MITIMDTQKNASEISRIAQGTKIKGEVTASGDIRIDGELEGKIMSDGKVLFGDGAMMKGNIEASDVDFYGKIEGDIIVRNVLSLKSTATVNGNIHVRKLQVDLGAQFNGACHMLSQAEEKVAEE